MSGGSGTRLVYSTGLGETCPECRQARASCRCATASEAAIPSVVTARLRLEKAGRGGKTVTVVDDLPRNAAFLKALSQELKKACGVGGTVQASAVELQGDQRDAVRSLLARKGYRVKG